MEVNAKTNSVKSIEVSKHAAERYLTLKGIRYELKNALYKQAQNEILNLYKNAEEIEIPESCKVLSLLNNNFQGAKYFYNRKRSILIVTNESQTKVLTCYPYNPDKSRKTLLGKARKTIQVQERKSAYYKTLEIKKKRSKYNDERELYRKERRWN
jgi:hypothetical protein